MSRIDTLLEHWAKTSTMKISSGVAEDKGFKLVYLLPDMSVSDYFAIKFLDHPLSNFSTGDAHADELNQAQRDRMNALKVRRERLVDKIGLLERFNGLHFLNTACGVNLKSHDYRINENGATNDSFWVEAV